MFDLCVRLSLKQLTSSGKAILPAPMLLLRLHDYIESALRAENLQPTPNRIAMLITDFAQLVALSRTGKPIIYRKRNSLSLLFDVFALQSEMSLEDPDNLVLGYTQSMMGFLLFNPEPAAIGMIGLGGGSLAKFCYRHVPSASITVAEIDPHVIALREQFRIPADDARLLIHCMDGANLVQDVHNRFDVLLIDGFDRDGQPPQLCSQHFYEDCRRALAPNGIMVVNLLGDVTETAILIDRINNAFEGIIMVIDALDSLNKVAFACKGDALDLADQVLTTRVDKLGLLHLPILRHAAHNILEQRCHANAKRVLSA